MSNNTILATAPLATTGFHIKATGTTLGNSLIWDNGTNVGIGNTNTSYTLDVSGTLRNTTSAYFATASGNVGIGTTTATNKLTITNDGNAANALRINDTNANASFLSLSASNTDAAIIANGTAAIPLDIYTGGSARVRVSATGNVGIGTSSPNSSFLLDINSSNTSCRLRLTNSITGTGISDGAALFMESLDMFVTNQEIGNLIFRTSEIERMRITSGGNVFIGYSGGITDTRLLVIGQTSGSAAYACVIKNSSSTNLFYLREDGAFNTGLAAVSPYNNTVGGAANINVDATGFLGRSTSSLKYKTEVKDYDKGLSKVMQLRPVYYKSTNKKEYDIQFAGLIAEEVNELGLTEFVQYAEDGTPDALAYSNMIALLTKAIQEMNTKLDEQNQTIQNLQEQINILAK